jgi:hypothetical protein
MYDPDICIQGGFAEPRLQWVPVVPPIFSRSFNPIKTRRREENAHHITIMPTTVLLVPQFFLTFCGLPSLIFYIKVVKMK